MRFVVAIGEGLDNVSDVHQTSGGGLEGVEAMVDGTLRLVRLA